MDTTNITRNIITGFIENIWNRQHFDLLHDYLHTGFTDHSLPPALPADKEGLQRWIKATSESFEHNTIIETQVCEGNRSIIKIRMQLKHIGTWRNIAPTGANIFTTGYRYFRIAENKIIEHWGLIDGNAIEMQLKDTSYDCKVQQ